MNDGSTTGGLKVDVTYLSSLPAVDTFVIVTGICRVEEVGSDLIPVLWPRDDSDVTTYTP